MKDKKKRKLIFITLIFTVLCISVFPRMNNTGTEKEAEAESNTQEEQKLEKNDSSSGDDIDNNKIGENNTDSYSQNDDEPKVYRGVEIVNKDNPLPEGYRPDDLREVNIPFNHPEGSEMNMMCDEAAGHLEEMVKAAEGDGINLIGVSGFRSYQYQEALYSDEVKHKGTSSADKQVARPGYSEHNTGLAIDLFSDDHPYLDEDFENSKAFAWLCSNCQKYGFILRYPKDKEDVTGYSYEPWHFRYTGTDIAKEIMDKNITLEEYISEN